MTLFKSIILSSAAATALIIPSLAAEKSDFSNVERLALEDFIGTIEIKVGAGDTIAVEKTDGANAAYPVRTKKNGDTLTINSDKGPDKTRWWKKVNWQKHNDKAFEVFLEDYPTLTITLPRGAAVSFDNAVIALDAGDTEGAFSMEGGYVEGEIGDIASAEIKITSSADLNVGNIARHLEIGIYGSGDITTGTAETAAISIHGSGDVEVGNIVDTLNTEIHGSGDVKLGGVGGEAAFSINGSGDINANDIGAGAEISINGSGDITLASVNGVTEVSIHGSGDTRINGGRAEDLKVRVHGSGDFRLQGLAANPNISAHGSGDVFVNEYEGVIHASGDGDIYIAGRNYGE